MSLEQQQKDLEEYVSWKAEKEVTGNDTSPGAYVIDKAKQAAFERVEAAITYLEELGAETWSGNEAFLFKILTGEN